MNEFIQQKQHIGLAVVISDFFDPKGFRPGLDVLRFWSYEPHLIQIHDKREANPSLLGDLQLHDVETGTAQEVTISESMVRQYKQKFTAFLDEIRRYGVDNGLNCTISSTAVPFDEMILKMLTNQQ
jgi:hypothetical protein